MTDQELDRLLYAHAGAARDLVLAQLPPEGELPDIPTSPRFQRRMKALIRRADRPGWAKAALRCARQAAVILLVCGTLTFSGLMVTSQAFRTQVLAVVTQVFQEFTEFRFSAREETARRAGDVALTYLPEGMEEIERETDANQCYIYFEDDLGNFMDITHIMIGPNTASTLGLDTENAEVEQFYIRGEQATAIYKKGPASILWTSGNSVYLLTGTISMDELKLVAAGVQ